MRADRSKGSAPLEGTVTPKQAGIRLILLALPFLAFGLLWALRPPLRGTLGEEITGLTQALGVAMAFLAVGAIALGVYLVRRPKEKVL